MGTVHFQLCFFFRFHRPSNYVGTLPMQLRSQVSNSGRSIGLQCCWIACPFFKKQNFSETFGGQ